jgi:hypothetical protein
MAGQCSRQHGSPRVRAMHALPAACCVMLAVMLGMPGRENARRAMAGPPTLSPGRTEGVHASPPVPYPVPLALQGIDLSK